MKKLLSALVAVFALLVPAVVTSAPATAETAAATVAAAPTRAAVPAQCYGDFDAEINGCRFWSGFICVDGSGINGSTYRVAYVAQTFNVRVNDPSRFGLQYEDDCAAAGYPPSRRMVIGSFHGGANGDCISNVNTQLSVSNGMARWTNGPGAYINIDRSACISTQTRRDHVVATAIGWFLGLSVLYSDGWASRVMCTCSFDTVATPSTNDGFTVYSLYRGYYGG